MMTRLAGLAAGLLVLSACGRLIPDAPGPTQTGPSPYAPVQTPVGSGLIDRPVDGGTRDRITRTAADPQQCVAELRAARINYVPSADRVNTETCFLQNAGVIGPDMGTIARLTPAEPTATCELALALSVWRRQVVEPAARQMLGADVVQIDHMGTYACRPVNNRAGARPSAHSRAAAFDFAGVRLRDGRRITVLADWNDGGPEGAFLKRIRDEGCRVFGTVLSPDYNAQHRDHLHLEPGQAFCR